MTDRTTQVPPQDAAPDTTHDPGVGELVGRLSEQVSRLVRDELRLAQAEVKTKGTAAGVGIGLFGGAGIIAAYGLGVLIAAAVLGLATVVAAWLAALLVGVAVLAIAGIVAVGGKNKVAQATPPVPAEAVSGVRRDVEALKGHHPSTDTSSATRESERR